MKVVHVANVNTALRWGIQEFSVLESAERNIINPRGMRTIESPDPVCTVYLRPTERVLFSPTRDANPFFHFFEALWMLAGRDDLAFVQRFNKGMAQYSDDGKTLWGAYGYRWRSFFGDDQIKDVIRTLHNDNNSRRAVLGMWSPGEDLQRGDEGGKDVPCNTHVYFKIRNGKLNMTVCNRSNDMIWGAYGANAVHMSMLQEYVAGKLNIPVGYMRQISDSLHIYLPPHRGGELWKKLREAIRVNLREFEDPYLEIKPYPMEAGTEGWDEDMLLFFNAVDLGQSLEWMNYRTGFWSHVVAPLWSAWETRDLAVLEGCAALDWKQAATEWIIRRKNASGALDVSV